MLLTNYITIIKQVKYEFTLESLEFDVKIYNVIFRITIK